MSRDWKLDRMNDRARFNGGRVGHGKIKPLEPEGNSWPTWVWALIGAAIVAIAVTGVAYG